MTIIDTIKFYENITSIPIDLLTVRIVQADLLQLSIEDDTASTFKIGIYGQTENNGNYTLMQVENTSNGEKSTYIETIGIYKIKLSGFLKFYVQIEELNSTGLTCQGQLISLNGYEVDETIPESDPIMIDSTLLISGAAADAYETGEAINVVANETYRLNRLGVFYWLPNTNYKIDNIVIVDNGSAHVIFKCIESHMSSDEFYKDDSFWEIVTPIHVELAIHAERDSNGNYITETYATKEELNNLKEIFNVIITIDENGQPSVNKTFNEIITARNSNQDISFTITDGQPSTHYLIDETSNVIMISTIDTIYYLNYNTDNTWSLEQTKVVTEKNNLVSKGDAVNSLLLHPTLAIANGVNSIAGGNSISAGSSTAKGVFSFAGGMMSEASGNLAFAYGRQARATKINSTAFGITSEATGVYSTAIGYNAKANGAGSFAIGFNTKANGDYSVALNYNTIANSDSQLVSGEYNISDENGEYLVIVGNGSGEDITDEDGNITTQNRSNAYTLDWEGTGSFAGKVKVGQPTTDEDDELVLVTKGYLKNYIASSIGTILNITADDEGKVLKVINGSPTWVDSEYQNAEEVAF